MTIISKKGAQDFHRALSKVFDRVKSVALWSANIRKTAQRTIRAIAPQLPSFQLLIQICSRKSKTVLSALVYN